MKLTVKHYYNFGALTERLGGHLKDDEQAWDILRLNEDQEFAAFTLPNDRKLWQERCLNNKTLVRDTGDILNFMDGKYRRVYSYGIGTAGLEFLLKTKKPDIYLVCSDFAQKTIERLKNVFVGCDEIKRFDILHDPWVKSQASSLHLFYRVETEFTDEELLKIFKAMREVRIDHILFIPGQLITLRRLIPLTIKNFLAKLAKRTLTFAGYLRSEDKMTLLLKKFYNIEQLVAIGEKKGFLLRLPQEPRETRKS